MEKARREVGSTSEISTLYPDVELALTKASFERFMALRTLCALGDVSL